MVTDLSAGALPIGMKFFRGGLANLGQLFFHFGGDSLRDGRVLGINWGHMAGYASC